MSSELLRGVDPTPNAGDGPGAMLRAARLARGLERERVASMLHLGERLIEALEDEDYAKLSGPVFVRGYIRNYARVLGIDEQPILEAYGARLPQEERVAPLGGMAGPRPVGSGHLGVRVVTGFVVIGLAFLVGLWAKAKLYPEGETTVVAAFDGGVGMRGEISRSGDMRVDEEMNAGAEELSFGPPTEEPRDQEPDFVEPGAAVRPVPPEAETGALSAAAPRTPVAVSRASQSPADRVQAPPALSGTSVSGSSSGDAIAATDASSEVLPRVVLEFSGPCWVDIKDSEGKNRVTGEQRKDAVLELAGVPPFSMVLGNSHAVRMVVDGKPYDLRKHSRGNVARFSFDPSDVSN